MFFLAWLFINISVWLRVGIWSSEVGSSDTQFRILLPPEERNMSSVYSKCAGAHEWKHYYINCWSRVIFSCDQAALWMVQSIRLSVYLSITHFLLCFHHRIIMKFSGIITNDRSDVHARGEGHRSKVKVTEVITHLSRFRIVTPVWIQVWWCNDV